MVANRAVGEGGGRWDVAGTAWWRIEDIRKISQCAVLHVPNESVEFSLANTTKDCILKFELNQRNGGDEETTTYLKHACRASSWTFPSCYCSSVQFLSPRPAGHARELESPWF